MSKGRKNRKKMPKLNRKDIIEHLMPLLEFYPHKDREIISGRVT